MGVDADGLIIRPFEEVVRQGQNAVSTAEMAPNDDRETTEQLAKAGRSLIREGDRALKKLRPVWEGQVTIFGDAFKNAVLAQGPPPNIPSFVKRTSH